MTQALLNMRTISRVEDLAFAHKQLSLCVHSLRAAGAACEALDSNRTMGELLAKISDNLEEARAILSLGYETGRPGYEGQS